jgi:hypothetical protein
VGCAAALVLHSQFLAIAGGIAVVSSRALIRMAPPGLQLSWL